MAASVEVLNEPGVALLARETLGMKKRNGLQQLYNHYAIDRMLVGNGIK